MGYFEGSAAQADNQYASGSKQAISVPELGRLKSAAERVSMATGQLDAFLFRFSGPRGGVAIGETAATCPPDTYRNDIDSLFAAVGYLEERVKALGEIG